MRSGSKCSRNSWYDFVCDSRFFQCGNFFLRATEQHGVATLQAHDDCVLARRVDEPLVDEALRSGLASATLADRDLLRALRERNRFRMHERVMEHNVRAFEETRCTQ